MDQEFIDLVARMRQAQKDYFRYRQPSTLQLSKALERQVDSVIEQHQNPDLFSEGQN